MAVVVVARELLVTALRSIVEEQGSDFSAKWAGKWKMVFQCLAAAVSLWRLWYYDYNRPYLGDRAARLDHVVTATVGVDRDPTDDLFCMGLRSVGDALAQKIGLRPASARARPPCKIRRAIRCKSPPCSHCLWPACHMVVSVLPVAANWLHTCPTSRVGPVPWGWPAASVAFIIVVLMLPTAHRNRLGGTEAPVDIDASKATDEYSGIHVVPDCRRGGCSGDCVRHLASRPARSWLAGKLQAAAPRRWQSGQSPAWRRSRRCSACWC